MKAKRAVAYNLTCRMLNDVGEQCTNPILFFGRGKTNERLWVNRNGGGGVSQLS